MKGFVCSNLNFRWGGRKTSILVIRVIGQNEEKAKKETAISCLFFTTYKSKSNQIQEPILSYSVESIVRVPNGRRHDHHRVRPIDRRHDHHRVRPIGHRHDHHRVRPIGHRHDHRHDHHRVRPIDYRPGQVFVLHLYNNAHY
ncbi:hypothetical protein AAEY33_10115 [Peribacillus simplex]|uniref:hypothetical protein n=1 Tax=Peribacillus simplex TaxID=1478 RepID=UPI003265EC0C